ncbi:calcyphosin-like protein [Trichonephila clavipes]|nr:calcyphosin-like protein [Trichonephila clavipes]
MYRPMSAQTRNENLMRASATRRLARATDPIEKLRLLCLQRGSSGILGLGSSFEICARDSVNGNTVALAVTVIVTESRNFRMAIPTFYHRKMFSTCENPK